METGLRACIAQADAWRWGYAYVLVSFGCLFVWLHVTVSSFDRWFVLRRCTVVCEHDSHSPCFAALCLVRVLLALCLLRWAQVAPGAETDLTVSI